MNPDYTTFSYHSEVNYLKKDLLLSEPDGQTYNTSTASAAVLSRNHGLGYRPNIEFAADLNNEGILWMGGRKLEAQNGAWHFSTGGTWDNPILYAWVDNDDLSFGQYYIDWTFSSWVNRDVSVRWNIYRDFGNQ